MDEDRNDWSRLSDGDLVIDEEVTFVTERSRIPTDLYRIRSEMLDWEATGLSREEVFVKAKHEVARRRADGRLDPLP
jgi:hypothetical protein